MLISIDNYNLENCSVIIAKQCIADNPTITRKDLAKALGCSERTIYRWINESKITLISKYSELTIRKSISILTKSGYKITKD